MRTFLNAKAMAKALREALAARGMEVTHSACLEIVARQFGATDWNTLAAEIANGALPASLVLPEDWRTHSPNPGAYRMGLDPRSKAPIALIESVTAASGGDTFATMMQSIAAEAYRGQRVRFEGMIRTEEVDGFAGLWLRIDGEAGQPLRFDNMANRVRNGAVRGTSGWVERQVVLDVPEAAQSLHYGLMLSGRGRAWGKGFGLDAAATGAGVTSSAPDYPKRPSNLDLSRRSAA